MLDENSRRPRSSWTLILCTCKLVGRNSSFLSPLRWLALKDGPEKKNTPEHDSPKPQPTQKILTSVVPEVCQGLLVAHQNRLELGDDLMPKVLPAGRQLAELLQLTNPDHRENPEEPSPWSGPSAGSYQACFQQQPCVWSRSMFSVCSTWTCPPAAVAGQTVGERSGTEDSQPSAPEPAVGSHLWWGTGTSWTRFLQTLMIKEGKHSERILPGLFQRPPWIWTDSSGNT